jgi:transposase
LTLVYDLQRARVVWVGRDPTRETMDRFFRWLGRRRARAIQTVCSDMASAYSDAIRQHLPQATHVIDRFHVSQHLSRAIDEIRRQTWRTLVGRQRVEFKHTGFLWLRNPENLGRIERTRLSALLRSTAPSSGPTC